MPETESMSAELLAGMARKNLAVYIPTVHRTDSGTPAIPPPHIRNILIPALMDDSLGNTVIVAPPGSAKTATMIAACCWWIGNTPNIRIGYISSTAGQTDKRSVAIRDTIAENKVYQAIFPEVKPDPVKGWTKSEWFIKRDDAGNKDPTFMAVGIESPGKMLGARFDRIILDDIANESNMNTLASQEAVKDTLKNTVITRDSGAGANSNKKPLRIIMIATRWAENDPVQWAIDSGWHFIHIPALNERNESYWEDNWPATKLKCPDDEHSLTGECCRFRAIGSSSFTQQYQGVVVDEQSSLIKREYWQYYSGISGKDPIEAIKDLGLTKVGLFVDVAHTTKDTSDYSVISAIGTDGTFYYLLDQFRKQVEFPELEKQCLAMRAKYPGVPMYLENTSGTFPLFQRLKTQIDMVHLFGLKNSNKVSRLNAVLPLFEANLVRIPAKAPWTEVTLTECALFPSGSHDDIVDTISMGLFVLGRKTRVATAL